MSRPTRTMRDMYKSSLVNKQRPKSVGRLRGRYLFRAIVRLVIEYKEWLYEDQAQHMDSKLDEGGDGGEIGVNVMSRKHARKDNQEFTAKDRSILLIPPDKRSKEEAAHLECLTRDLKAFKKYPEDVRDALARECTYQYVPAGRTIVRQGHKAYTMYFVVRGELEIFMDVVDEKTGEVTGQNEVGLLQPGDMIGEIALLHNIRRSATVISKTSVDLLLITRSLFREYLRDILMNQWDQLHDVLLNFNYFKGWSEKTMRECWIVSKVVNYDTNDILLGDGKGMVHYVYFVISGECRLIEHMLVEKYYLRNKVKYKLFDSSTMERNPRRRASRSRRIVASDDDLSSLNLDTDKRDETPDFMKILEKKKKAVNHVAMDRISVITVTLQDVLNQWHEITDVVEMLIKQPSTASMQDYPENVKTVFMQIGMFYRGACFGLGETMRNRRIIATTPVKCLLIPNFWLTQHNRANIWDRVKSFLNSKYPSNKELLQKYVENKKWAGYKQDYVKELMKNGRQIPLDTKLYDVPYSIRINAISTD
ncbi:uncharacterized protein LOC106652987 [Trichogramma pretiosum]|uniref:uncharacterized protein LOC106652987 n=1 Tax=Trichogramma pretiosum TaxID=7493 RepID=UPI000C718900|nr:uncharacterized protein LOC106652987 [Trichogramma pretiosum]